MVAAVAVLGAVTSGGVQASYFQAPQSAGVCEGVDDVHGIGDPGLRGAQVAWGNTIGAPSPAAPLAQGFGYDAGADHAACDVFKTAADGGTKVFDYRDTGSGSCLSVLGASGPRQFGTVDDVGYCGSEVAPTEAQIFAAEGGRTSTPAHPSEAQLLTIPVAQVSVAVAVRLPDGCQVADSSKRRISRDDAAAAFRGAITKWVDVFGADIAASPGSGVTSTDCQRTSFKRVVRRDSSGTTFLLKRYPQRVSDLPGGSTFDWREPSFGGRLANDEWPNDSGATAVLRGDEDGAGSQLDTLSAQSVDGGIAYADVATSRGNDYAWDYAGPGYVADDRRFWLRVQRVVSDSYYSPAVSNAQSATGASLGAACVDVQYANQPTANLGQSWAAATAVATPTGYSVCGLNYVVTSLWGLDTEAFAKVWAGSTAGEWRAMRDYLRYVTGLTRPGVGQSRLAPAGYAKLPADITATGRCAVKQIGWLRAGADPQPASRVSRDPTGNDPACLAPDESATYAWGDNYFGQLGNGATTDSSTPVSVSGITNATAVAGGGYHSVALLSDGTVKSWGVNGASTTPVTVAGLSTAIAVAGGGGHSLAVLSDGTVRAWGGGGNGQLGDGTLTSSSTPVSVPGLSTATAVAGGDYHSLAVLSDGTVRAWGLNYFGQLGNGATTDSSTLVTVSGITNATAVAGGGYHSVALLSDGTVKAWGDNDFGQLGDGTTTDSSTPVSVAGLSTASAVAGGDYHSLALLSDGTVKDWGEGNDGQLGDGTTTTSSTPVTVSGLTDVVAIKAGGHHSLALKADGTLWAWGANNNGQLGDGTRADRAVPVRVEALKNVDRIAAGGDHSLALTPLRPEGV